MTKVLEANNMNESGTKIIQKDRYDINLATQKFILQMCWAQHDGQWFLKSKRKYGIEEGNKLNHEVISSMGRIEARHILSALGIKKGTVKSMSEIFKLMNTFMDIIIPRIMKFKFVVDSETEGRGIVNKCFIWEEVKKSKSENEYFCACNNRHRGWLQTLGVDGKIIPLKRFCDGDNCCEFKFVLKK